MVLHLPEELARRVAAVAAARQQTPEQVALDAIATAVQPGIDQAPAKGQLLCPDQPVVRRQLGFAGIGCSGPQGSTTARDHRQLRSDAFAMMTARDV